MVEIVLAILLAAHLLLVDVAMCGPLASVWIDWRGRCDGDPRSDAIARRLARWSLAALVGGSALGGVLLGVLYLAGDSGYFAAAGAVPVDRLWFALAELLFSFGCLAAYVALWDRWSRRRVLHRLLALAGTSNLLVHFPALFAIISVITTRPGLAATGLDRAAYRRLLVDAEVVSRVTHVWLAAAAVTGIVVMWLSVRAGGAAGSDRPRHLAFGGRLALVATLLQLPAGVWLVLEMPESARGPLLGGDLLTAGLFLAALVVSMYLLHVLAAVALGDVASKQVHRAMALVAVVVLLMVGTRLRLGGQTILPAAGASSAASPSHAAASANRLSTPAWLLR